jgi:hypothetical protein
VAGADDYEPAKHRIVGALASSIYWRILLRDTLPPNSNGIQVVFNNSCTKPFTYQVNGPDVKYIGVGDHHDKHNNAFGNNVSFSELGAFANRDSVYSGARLESDYCPFTLHLYPSDEMKATFVTNHPLVFSMVTFFIFLFTSLVFALYDRGVERRQRMVMTSAERSSTIVSSLFPSTVRDRLYAIPENGTARLIPKSAKGKLHRFIREENSASKPTVVASTLTESPIAELYQTHLLEAVYGAFDAIANRRGVFKVDCSRRSAHTA